MVRCCVLIFIGCLPWFGHAAQAPIERFEILTPRPFGYLIGDLIRHEIQLEVTKPYVLQKASIPSAGNLKYWLELRSVALEESERKTVNRYRILLTYQTFYAPVEVKALSMPAFQLVVSGPDRDLDLPIPAWEFTMSALRELEVRIEGEREYMRPDAKPRSLDVHAQKNRLLVLTAALGATLLYTLWRYGQWPGRRRKPFARASRELRRLRGKVVDPIGYQQALQRVHHAFNQTAGAPIFAHALERFLREHPTFLPLKTEITVFFDSSQRIFFAAGDLGTDHYPWHALEQFCRRCQECERESR